MAGNRRRATVMLEEGKPRAATLKRLRAAGFKVETPLDAIGAVTGTVAEDKAHALHRVEGVKGVEFEKTFQLAPPESGIQ